MADALEIYTPLLAPLFASFMCGAILQQWIHRREFNEWCKMFNRLFEIAENAQKIANDAKGGE